MLRRCDQVLCHVDIDAAIDAALRHLTVLKRQLLEHGRISRRDFTSYGQNIHRRRFLEKQQRCYSRECRSQAALTPKSSIFS